MDHKRLSAAIILASFLLGFMIIAGSILLPSWGKLSVLPIQSVTVVGEAKSQEKSQIATFNAGVNAYGDDKQAAINEVNTKVAAIIQAVKEFGIVADDIKTQSLNVYQNQDSYYEDGRQKLRPGQWNVSNTVEIKLRDVDRAATLASVLSKGGATNIYGPNFMFDDTSEASNALIGEALSNAKAKAEQIAQASGRKVGKVIAVTEGTDAGSSPIYKMQGDGFGGGGGNAVAPGSGTVYKTVTVTYELK
jgi:uncharacterized protein YggE